MGLKLIALHKNKRGYVKIKYDDFVDIICEAYNNGVLDMQQAKKKEPPAIGFVKK